MTIKAQQDVTASIDPAALGPLFVNGDLTSCKLEDGEAVWRWSNGIVLSLNTDTMHWHVSVDHSIWAPPPFTAAVLTP